MFPEHISESDKREAWVNLQAFCKAFNEVEARHKARNSASPHGESTTLANLTHTATGKSKPARETRPGQVSFSANKRRDNI